MRASTAALLIVAMSAMLLSTDVEAGESPFAITVFGGMATPTGNLSEYWSSGFSFGGSVSYQMNDIMAIECAAANGQRFGFDESTFYDEMGLDPGLGSVDGASANALSLTGGLRLGKTNASINPYGAVGAGYYRLSLSDVTVQGFGLVSQTVPGWSRNAFGMNFGGGVQAPMSPTMSVFGELRYHVAFVEGETATYLPITGGVRFNW